jgi:long-chain acyl-CoA synthetase
MSRTLIRLFQDTVARWHKPAQFLRRGEHGWESISADRALTDVEAMGTGLLDLGLRRGDRVAIISSNRYEWVVADLAAVGIGAVTVPIYATLTADQCREILAAAGVKLVFVSDAEQAAKIRAIRSALPDLAWLVAMDPIALEGTQEVIWQEVHERGAQLRVVDPLVFRAEADRVQPEDLATIIFTSGTTGTPKGAMLSHQNITLNAEYGLKVIDLGPSDLNLSFLPLSHIFERMAGCYTMMAAGVSTAFARSMDTVAEDAREVRPTVITGVPRLFEKVRMRVLENARSQPVLRRAIFAWCLKEGRRRARAHLAWRRSFSPLAPLTDRLVGAQVRARLGGRLRMGISGGSALHPMVLEFFFAMGIPVIEGYGLTETSPVICLTPLGRERPGSVGPPLPGIEVKIGEQGEILTRSACVMMGYWNDEDATEEAMRGGWFHTGDVGFIDPDGYLHITDRLKDLIVTAGGKNVAPQPIEANLKASKWVTEAVLIGDDRPYVVVLLVPNFERVESLARRNGWTWGTRTELLARPEVQGIVQRRLDRLNSLLAPFEQVKRFALLDHEMTQEGGELTPTLKVRRRVVHERYARIIDSLYQTPSAAAEESPASAPEPEEN